MISASTAWPTWPRHIRKTCGARGSSIQGTRGMAGLPRLDRIDINILAQLQQNSRLTNVDLAAAVGLSPSPCLARVRRLEKAGYIASYNARLNLAKLTDHITVFTEVTLGDHRREDFIRFEAEI